MVLDMVEDEIPTVFWTGQGIIKWPVALNSLKHFAANTASESLRTYEAYRAF